MSFKTSSSKLIDIVENYFTIQQVCEQVSNNTKPVDTIK